MNTSPGKNSMGEGAAWRSGCIRRLDRARIAGSFRSCQRVDRRTSPACVYVGRPRAEVRESGYLSDERNTSIVEVAAVRVPGQAYDVAILGGGLAGLTLALQL